MRIYDVIEKKRDGKALTKEEIDFFIKGYTNEEIKDYQAAALLMAIYFNGMNEEETVNLTLAMATSGEIVDLSKIEGIKVDKHSTGGVGDKTTLIITPIVASLGVKVAKMSGRGLGHTGGTIDKMESIPGLKTNIENKTFFEIVNKIGASVVGQSGNLAPADKKLYALRDVTGTVESLPLIASSIMSKKIAAGSDCILLDVKTGSGAFMKTPEDAIDLAETMVKIGKNANKKIAALITDMDRPLGLAIGNSLEIIEVCQTLKGQGPEDLTEISVELAAYMLKLAGKGKIETCRLKAKEVLQNGLAFKKLKEIIAAQGGDISVLEDNEKFPKAKYSHKVLSPKAGYIFSINTEDFGKAAMILGAGRETKEEQIDFSAGIILNKTLGNRIEQGEVLATFYSSSKQKCQIAEQVFLNNLKIEEKPNKENPLIFKVIE